MNPTRSQNRTVTTFRSSSAGGGAVSARGAAHSLQNFAPAGFSVPQSVQITPSAGAAAQLGVSLTDGNIIPTVQGVMPYTINFNNAGSILSGTGTNAGGVVLTETVPANTTVRSPAPRSADRARSTGSSTSPVPARSRSCAASAPGVTSRCSATSHSRVRREWTTTTRASTTTMARPARWR